MDYIVNADDFGRSEEINRAICEGFSKGYINRTTIMVNMPYADQAVELAKANGFFDKVGLHINLTAGRPLTDGIKNNPLVCDKDGCFHAAFARSTKYRLYMDEQTVNQFAEEIGQQLEKYKEYGFTLWHVDSHHHVHTNYPVYRALKKLALRYHFSSIRISRNMYSGGSLFNKIYKYIYNSRICKLCDEVSDLFGSYTDFCDYKNQGLINESANKKVEIMVHPEYDGAGNLIDTTNDKNVRFDEYKDLPILTDNNL